jgi:hypothetical protein
MGIKCGQLSILAPRVFPFLISSPVPSATMGRLSVVEQLSLLSIFGAGVGILANTFHDDGEPLIAALAFSGVAFSLTYALIRWLGEAFMKAGFKGKDLSKTRTNEMYARVNTCFDPIQPSNSIPGAPADHPLDPRPWAPSAPWYICW